MTKDLKEKAVDIKGKKYVLVADRISYFNETYKKGSIVTDLISPPDNNRFVIQAIVTPDVDVPQRKFTGYSQAVIGEGMVNKTAALENAETSAVGRALAMMGIGVVESIASADEMHKAFSRGGDEPEDEKTTTVPLDPAGQELPEKKQCPKHSQSLTYLKSKEGKHWYSHVLPDKSWCNTDA